MSQINDLPLHSIQGIPDGRRIAFVQAQWHADIVHQARDAFLAELERQGIPADTIDVFDVPGAFEIPLHAKRLAQSGRYAAIVGCALVVDGGIYRHEFVATTVVNALMTLQEYLEDYASPETKELGNALITRELDNISTAGIREITLRNLKSIEQGQRDFRF